MQNRYTVPNRFSLEKKKAPFVGNTNIRNPNQRAYMPGAVPAPKVKYYKSMPGKG